MAWLNVWVPDDIAARARAEGLNVSALTQAALQQELSRRATDHWLDQVIDVPQRAAASHPAALAALDDARDEFGSEPSPASDSDDRLRRR